MKMILLICNKTYTVINFRKELILFLKAHGYRVAVIASDDERKDAILELGVDFYCVPYDNRSMNPFAMMRTESAIRRRVAEIKPDIVFTFQIKANTLGVMAAKKAGVTSIFSMVEGLGDPFQPQSLVGKMAKPFVRSIYKNALKNTQKVFFLNDSDAKSMQAMGIVDAKKTVVIPGIGIDTRTYPYSEILAKEKRVIVLSRLAKSKGILECAAVAKKVHETRPDILFEIYGKEGDLIEEDLSPYGKDIAYRGFTTNPQEPLRDSRILLSCSYHEGFPRTILEAMALGRVSVVSDVIGNRDAVKDGVTGYLIPARDIDGFARKIIEIIDDDALLLRLGKQAREMCVKEHDSEIINARILDVLTEV